MSNQKSIVVVSWDGKSKPLSHILFDTPPQFDFLVVDYSGEDHFSELSKISPAYYIAQKSECKGDLINNVYTYLQENNISPQDVDPDTFVRWVYAKALAHRQPRYRAMANWGVTDSADEVAKVADTAEFEALIAQALERRC